MAERWYNAVRQQEWSDASGKFKTTAKYVEHDPNFAWVKLRVIRGTGKERVVKDVQIPLDKLSKACQARVRTISVLAEKIAEAKEDEAKKESEEEEDADAAGGRGGESLDGEPPATKRWRAEGPVADSIAGWPGWIRVKSSRRANSRRWSRTTVRHCRPLLPPLANGSQRGESCAGSSYDWAVPIVSREATLRLVQSIPPRSNN